MVEREPLSYRTLAHLGRSESVINKSRFIGLAAPALTEEDAQAFLEQVRRDYPDASCICHGYISGYFGQLQRFYDGHEPVGGMPILECLKKQQLTGCVCAVVRYFGGIKLGAGGLARAFGSAAAAAVLDAEPCMREKTARIRAVIDYSALGKVEHFFSKSPFRLENTEFGEHITLTMTCPLNQNQTLAAQLEDLLSGRIQMEMVEIFYDAWL